jgi:hypothetical protein
MEGGAPDFPHSIPRNLFFSTDVLILLHIPFFPWYHYLGKKNLYVYVKHNHIREVWKFTGKILNVLT